MDLGALVTRIKALDEGLKKISPSLGYTEVKDLTNKRVAYRVHYWGIFPDRDIRVGQGWGVAEAALLKELTMLAQHYKPSLLLPDHPDYPGWVVPEALEFLKVHQSLKPGLYKFGNAITIPGKAGGMPTRTTKEQLIFASTTEIQVFRYWPTKRQEYSKDLYYDACMNWNLSMYDYIEQQRLPPSQAIDTLTLNQVELIKRIQAFLMGRTGGIKRELTKGGAQVLFDVLLVYRFGG